jgi:hypothetical protein
MMEIGFGYYWRWEECRSCGHIKGFRFEESYGLRYVGLRCSHCHKDYLAYDVRMTGENIPMVEEEYV